MRNRPVFTTSVQRCFCEHWAQHTHRGKAVRGSPGAPSMRGMRLVSSVSQSLLGPLGSRSCVVEAASATGQGQGRCSHSQADADQASSSATAHKPKAGAGPGLSKLANVLGAAGPAVSQAATGMRPDLFTRNAQAKTEQQLMDLIEKTRAAKLASSPISSSSAVAAEPQTEEEAEEDSQVNKATGEEGGPRGPEPTRHGDWEVKGRCSDF